MLSPLFDCCYFLKRSRQGEFVLIVVGGRDVDEKTLGSQEKAHWGYWSPSIRDSTQWASTPSRCGSLSQRPIAPQQWSNTCFLGKAREQPSCTGLLEIWSGEGASWDERSFWVTVGTWISWDEESISSDMWLGFEVILNMGFIVQCSYCPHFIMIICLKVSKSCSVWGIVLFCSLK